MEQVIGETREEKQIDAFFHWGIIIKGIQGAIELLSGIAVYLIPPASVIDFVSHFTEAEIIRDPDDYIANHLIDWATGFTPDAQLFAVLYLISHGIVKLFLAVSLLSNKIWAYPTGIIVIGLMNLYQIYHLYRHFSIFLTVATFFNFVIIWLIWREWQIKRTHE